MPGNEAAGNGEPDLQEAAGRQGTGLSDSANDQQAAAPPAGALEATGAPPPGMLPKELTFALKLDPHAENRGGANVQENSNAQDKSKGAQAGTSAKLPAPVKSSAGAVKAVEEPERAEPEAAETPAPRTDAFARISSFQANWQNPPSSGPDSSSSTRLEPSKALETASAVQTPTPDATGKAAGPLKELSIQVGQTQQDRVELRVVDRSGEVQVAVRATSPDVAEGLRQGLSDLVGRLEQNGYRTEAWRPGGAVTSVQGTGESRQKEMQFQQDGSQSQSGGSQQGRQQNQQNQQNQTYRPRWVQELEGSFSDNSNSSAGEWNGLTN